MSCSSELTVCVVFSSAVPLCVLPHPFTSRTSQPPPAVGCQVHTAPHRSRLPDRDRPMARRVPLTRCLWPDATLRPLLPTMGSATTGSSSHMVAFWNFIEEGVKHYPLYSCPYKRGLRRCEIEPGSHEHNAVFGIKGDVSYQSE
ncbi:hypothetical protein WMY93_005609 [Mugilogobius chulae]|uniref:Secreted protein n=1 Tax=Mugilogobius chulae TaxID=88201 RepID=A0AAW0PT54_9GOBI